ncbi:MAG: saccharopine dehydrogenase NADP-binding domain-containing protein [Pirellulaceae bacterium]|nr:saccharopine dehydrogenase NADP-binding domain-containing protein [Pirellulaceae bacterium]
MVDPLFISELEKTMDQVLLLGGGKIGRMIAKFLTESGHYRVRVADVDSEALARIKTTTDVEVEKLDVTQHDQLSSCMQDCQSVVSALSFRFNPSVAQAALETGTNYFDLTEDVATTRAVRDIAKRSQDNQIFMPQCGLAPGFISIAAHHLTKSFDRLDRVHMRVGALPEFPTGELKYNLTWSTDGLINEYCNPCEAIHEGKRIDVLPLEGLEHFSLDGVRYEAFNTSGGLGTLCETLNTQVRELNYKTVRYLGHRQLMQFLVGELRMSEQRDQLKKILEDSIPITFQDVVVTFCTVSGWRNGNLVQMSDARKIYAETIDNEPWSAIQLTTAAGICAVIDLAREGHLPPKGFVKQEDVNFDDFLNNQFGRRYANQAATRFSNASSQGETNE